MRVRVISVVMALLMAMSVLVTGCGKKEPYAYELHESLGTINGENIDYRFVYFAAMCEQASIESYYYESLGPEMWEEKGQDGKTMEESVKATILQDLKNMLVLEIQAKKENVTLTDKEVAAIKAAAEAFMTNNTEEAIAQMGATKEIVERYLTLYTISNMMYERIIAQADTDFELEEYKRTKISYIKLDRDDYLLLEARDVLEECKTKYDELTGKDGEFKATEVIYGKDGTIDLNVTEDVLKAVAELKDGEVCPEIFIKDGFYMIVRLEAEFDTEASASAKEYLIEQAETKLYNEVIEGYSKDVTFEVNEEAWAALKFNRHFKVK